MFSRIPGLCPLDAIDTLPVVTTENVSGDCQVSAEGQNPTQFGEALLLEKAILICWLTAYVNISSNVQFFQVLCVEFGSSDSGNFIRNLVTDLMYT